MINPTGGADVEGVGSKVMVTIEHSDQAFGVFQFHDRSLVMVAEEQGGPDGYIGYLEVSGKLETNLLF